MKKLLFIILFILFANNKTIAQTFEMTKTVVNVENNSILTYFEYNGVQFSISENGQLRYRLPINASPVYNNGRIERIAFKNDFAKNIKVYYGNNNEIIKISQNGTNLNSIKFVFNYNINKIERIVLSLHPEHNIKFHYNNDSTIYNVSNNNSKITFYYENNAFIKTRGTIDNYNVEIVNFTDTW